MFIKLFLGAAAACVLLLVLAVKIKKLRGLFGGLAVIALLPTVVLGLIAFEAADIINYPGDPAAAVEGMTSALAAGEYEAADDYVYGTLGLVGDDKQAGDLTLIPLVCESLSAQCGEPRYEEFTAIVPVELTVLDTHAWLGALAAESEAVLAATVEASSAKVLYNDDRDAYLDGVTEGAYTEALQTMWNKGGEYLHTVSVDVTLFWTPFGWQILMDGELLCGLEGYDNGEQTEITKDGAMAERLSARMTTAHGDIVNNLPLIYKTYKIPVEDLAAPKPDPDRFGMTTDPAVIEAVIEQAAPLVGDRKISWNRDIVIKPNTQMQYYFDESILAITWKEDRDGCCVTFGEVIIKDGSQIRRVLADNTYRSFNWETPSQMAQRTNAVLGMTGDFYMFRQVGIMAYQGQVYRTDPSSLAHAFFTYDGDMILTKGHEVSQGQAEQYVKDNNVNFSLGFGPVIIENYEVLPHPPYILGEFLDNYPRAAIGEVDPLHFIVMTAGNEGEPDRTITLSESTQFILEKGVHKAYNLDGGKTANMTFNGVLTADPVLGAERTMSDIFYFASAVPESER